MKIFEFNCIEVPRDRKKIFEISLENMRVITFLNFVKECEIDIELLRDMVVYPNDYNFYQYGKYYIYQHSCIEYFYI